MMTRRDALCSLTAGCATLATGGVGALAAMAQPSSELLIRRGLTTFVTGVARCVCHRPDAGFDNGRGREGQRVCRGSGHRLFSPTIGAAENHVAVS
jgi:hypothetical protein